MEIKHTSDPITAGDAVQVYCDLKRAERETWRAVLDIDRRRKGWREKHSAATEAHIAAEDATAAFLVSIGLDPEQVWS